jgi:putative membrane protein
MKGAAMKRHAISLSLVLVAGLLTGCAVGDSTKFSSAAAQGGLTEVELGRLAVQKASNPAVKSFGQRMIEDHSRANDELKTIATKKNIALPQDLNSDQKTMKDKLSSLVGADFDKQYMSDMVKDHEADAKEFENQANKGTDADIKAFAAKTLPMIQRHLQMARDALNQVSAK